jgi:hypothetical protein
MLRREEGDAEMVVLPAVLGSALDDWAAGPADRGGGHQDPLRRAAWRAALHVLGGAFGVSPLGDVLDEVGRFLRRFVVFQQAEASDFLALWVAHTWCFEAAITTPYVRVSSPERESGKTRTFEVLAVLVRRPWLNAVVSTAILYRKGDAESPTLLLDEVDNIDFASRNELLGVLNSGYRMGIKVSRCDDRGNYKDFDPFYPKAFAGIAGGKLPDTLHSRSVAVRLQRRRPDEPVERFFHHRGRPRSGAAARRARESSGRASLRARR